MKNLMIFGEVLFDIFPDGNKVFGGAPFNVAWHLHGLGADPLFVGRVGDDNNGKKIISKMGEWEMNMKGIQIDSEHPTGRVTIKLKDGQPAFNIEADQAYDFISADETLNENGSDFDLLYYGSLALRTKKAKENLKKIKDEIKTSIFVDINLREPWWSKESVKNMIRDVRWVKLNDEELAQIMDAKFSNNNELIKLAKKAREKFGNEVLIVTAGEKGAYFITKNKAIFQKPRKVKNLLDTVGAGDAFSAVSILGFINDWPLELIAERAVDFAADVCEIQGATISDKGFYRKKLCLWKSSI